MQSKSTSKHHLIETDDNKAISNTNPDDEKDNDSHNDRIARKKCGKVICKQIRVEIKGKNYKGSYYYNRKRERYEKKNSMKFYIKKARGRGEFELTETERKDRNEYNCKRFMKNRKERRNCRLGKGKYFNKRKIQVTKTLLKGKYRPKYNLTLTVNTLANKKTCEPWQVDWMIKKGKDRGKKIEVTCADKQENMKQASPCDCGKELQPIRPSSRIHGGTESQVS